MQKFFQTLSLINSYRKFMEIFIFYKYLIFFTLRLDLFVFKQNLTASFADLFDFYSFIKKKNI